MKNYYKVDIVRHDGYSFMVCSNENWDDDNDIIEECEKQGLFDEDKDYIFATIDRLVDDNDIRHFKDCTYEI